MKAFEQNARVCFLGDSITHNNNFVSYISAYYHEYFKDLNVNFYNCGVGSGCVETLLAILEDDVFVHNPTHAVIMIGINDSNRNSLNESRSLQRYHELQDAFETYKKNLDTLCKILTERNVEVILCTPTPYDEYSEREVASLPGGYALMAGYAEFVRNYAKQESIELCDYHEYLTRMMQMDELYSPGDRIHPNLNGHYQIAKCFLAAQGLDIGVQQPFPEYMNEWREKVQKLRWIRQTEYLVINDYKLSDEERLDFVKKYMERPKRKDAKYVEACMELSAYYLQLKPQQKELEHEVDVLMEKVFKEQKGEE